MANKNNPTAHNDNSIGDSIMSTLTPSVTIKIADVISRAYDEHLEIHAIIDYHCKRDNRDFKKPYEDVENFLYSETKKALKKDLDFVFSVQFDENLFIRNDPVVTSTNEELYNAAFEAAKKLYSNVLNEEYCKFLNSDTNSTEKTSYETAGIFFAQENLASDRYNYAEFYCEDIVKGIDSYDVLKLSRSLHAALKKFLKQHLKDDIDYCKTEGITDWELIEYLSEKTEKLTDDLPTSEWEKVEIDDDEVKKLAALINANGSTVKGKVSVIRSLLYDALEAWNNNYNGAEYFEKDLISLFGVED